MGFLGRLFGNEPESGEDRLREALGPIVRIIDDEEFQLSLVPDILADAIKQGAAVDRLPDGRGAFGLESGNPIPVNGPLGEVAYLSRLVTEKGERLLFHRIGAINTLDVFEAVTFSGSAWYVFFLDMYHPRRSRLAPTGFRIADRPCQFSGFHNYCPNFPYDFAESKQHLMDLVRLAYIPLSSVMPQAEKRAFSRPLAHRAKVDLVTAAMTSRRNA